MRLTFRHCQVLSVAFQIQEGIPDHMTIQQEPLYQGAGLALLTGPCVDVHDIMGHLIPIFSEEIEVIALADSSRHDSQRFV